MIILSLFDRSAVALRPWKVFGGHHCIAVDIDYENDHVDELGILRLKRDIFHWRPDFEPDWVLCWPPCTHLSASGAKHWQKKGLPKLIEGLQLVNAAHEICLTAKRGWLIENPIGRLSTIWRPPDHYFNPSDYGDPYTKRTCLWVGGDFVMPPIRSVEPVQGSKMHLLSQTKDRARLRSVTPEGFARAVYIANR